jgi:hypothetical protein
MAFDFQVTIDCSAPHELAEWWAEALGWQVEPQDESFIRRMVEEGAATEEDTARHRLHVDVRVGAERREAEVARLLDLGATELWRSSQGPYEWVTLADPEGNEFCVT